MHTINHRLRACFETMPGTADSNRGIELTLASGVRVSFHDGGAVLLHQKRGVVYMTNASGSSVIKNILNGFDSGRVAEELSKTYEISMEQTSKDVVEFLAALDRGGFLACGEAAK